MTEITVRAGVVAELLARLPARLIRRLEADPGMDTGWQRHLEGGTLTVTVGEDTVVTLRPGDGVISSVDQVRCTCLIGPACVHAIATLRNLPLDGQSPPMGTDESAVAGRASAGRASAGSASAGAASAGAADTFDAGADVGAVRLKESQAAAADRAFGAIARLLGTGAVNAGLVVEADLLRAAQGCRAEGLHRISSGLLRTVQLIRDLHAERSEFRLETLAAGLADAAVAADILSRNPERASQDLVGLARRSYRDVGTLKLTGLFCEPVVSAAGYAGVVTHLISDDGRCWTVPAVMPGDIQNVIQAYKGPAAIGDASRSHQSLARAGLYMSNATASEDGRLGSGRTVSAVSRDTIGWDEPEVAARFRRGIEDQLESSADGLLFIEAEIRGTDGEALVLQPIDGAEAPIRATVSVEHVELPGRENLQLLACARGLVLRVIGRIDNQSPRTVRLLAAGAHDDGQLVLPPNWCGRFNVGLDRLQRGNVPNATDQSVTVARRLGDTPDPITPFRRRLQRAVYGGRSTTGPLARSGISQDEQLLNRSRLPTAGALLRAMADAANDDRPFAHAWTGSAVYEAACSKRLDQGRWLRG